MLTAKLSDVSLHPDEIEIDELDKQEFPNPFIKGWVLVEHVTYDNIFNLVNKMLLVLSYTHESPNERLNMINHIKFEKTSPIEAILKSTNNTFKINIYKRFKPEFFITRFEEYIYDNFKPSSNETKLVRFLNFFGKAMPLLKVFHELYLKLYCVVKGITVGKSVEETKKVLIDAASLDKRKPMNLEELMSYINDRLLIFHRVFTSEEMFEFYKHNLPQKVIKTKEPQKQKEINPKEHVTEVVNPWRSKNKVMNFGKRNGWSDWKIESVKEDIMRDSFNTKKQAKSYMLRTVAPRHSFIIDYFFPGKFIYLLAVNVNTRKAFAIPSPEIRELKEGRWTISTKGNKTEETAIKQLEKLMKRTVVKHIMCDLEKAFMSKAFKNMCSMNRIELNYYHKNDLKGFDTKETSRGNHGTLAILDRLCRTLRMMNNNLGNGEDIPPNIMKFLIKEYNDSPHATLSKYAEAEVSPNDVDGNPQLEDFICNKLMKENVVKKLRDDWNVNGLSVRCLNESGKFDKVKRKLLPGRWNVKGNENGLFVCSQGDKIIKMPRWMIKTGF